MSLVDEELSEPYSIFTYRYFVYIWPQLTFLVRLCPLLALSS
jgi:peptide alpha-N-acetyltransferase